MQVTTETIREAHGRELIEGRHVLWDMAVLDRRDWQPSADAYVAPEEIPFVVLVVWKDGETLLMRERNSDVAVNDAFTISTHSDVETVQVHAHADEPKPAFVFADGQRVY